MIESILYRTAIYCRLPLDDGSLGESGSIQTQKDDIWKEMVDAYDSFLWNWFKNIV